MISDGSFGYYSLIFVLSEQNRRSQVWFQNSRGVLVRQIKYLKNRRALSSDRIFKCYIPQKSSVSALSDDIFEIFFRLF